MQMLQVEVFLMASWCMQKTEFLVFCQTNCKIKNITDKFGHFIAWHLITSRSTNNHHDLDTCARFHWKQPGYYIIHMDDGTEMNMASYPLLAKLEGQSYVSMIHEQETHDS